MAALWSRSSRVPQVSQANSRSARVSFGFHRTARRAGLAGGVPPVSDEDAHCGVGGLVLDLVPELAHAQPADVPGQAPVADHPGDVQVFDHDHVVLGDEAGGEFVQSVAALVRDAGVQRGDSRRGFAPPVGRVDVGAPVWPASSRAGALSAAQAA